LRPSPLEWEPGQIRVIGRTRITGGVVHVPVPGQSGDQLGSDSGIVGLVDRRGHQETGTAHRAMTLEAFEPSRRYTPRVSNTVWTEAASPSYSSVRRSQSTTAKENRVKSSSWLYGSRPSLRNGPTRT